MTSVCVGISLALTLLMIVFIVEYVMRVVQGNIRVKRNSSPTLHLVTFSPSHRVGRAASPSVCIERKRRQVNGKSRILEANITQVALIRASFSLILPPYLFSCIFLSAHFLPSIPPLRLYHHFFPHPSPTLSLKTGWVEGMAGRLPCTVLPTRCFLLVVSSPALGYFC